MTTHGHTAGGSTTVEYSTWAGMKNRTLNPNCPGRKRYSERGIKICFGWMSFENFFNDMGKRPEGLSIERKNNNGHYSCGHCEQCLKEGWPMNCKWDTSEAQANNTSTNRMIPWRGEVKTLAQWLRIIGLNRATFKKRVKRGMTDQQALETPVDKKCSHPGKTFQHP
jgi:hypothetical protein